MSRQRRSVYEKKSRVGHTDLGSNRCHPGQGIGTPHFDWVGRGNVQGRVGLQHGHWRQSLRVLPKYRRKTQMRLFRLRLIELRMDRG